MRLINSTVKSSLKNSIIGFLMKNLYNEGDIFLNLNNNKRYFTIFYLNTFPVEFYDSEIISGRFKKGIIKTD